MRPDLTEKPYGSESAGEYFDIDVARRAQTADESDFPHVEAIHEAMRVLRRAGAKSNGLGDLRFDPENEYYGPPFLRVCDCGMDLVLTLPWDRSGFAIEEAAEVAKALGGVVLIGQDIFILTDAGPSDHSEDNWMDEGFDIEVWPRFVTRPSPHPYEPPWPESERPLESMISYKCAKAHIKNTNEDT